MPPITLPASLHSVAGQLAEHAGFASTADYIAELLRRDLENRRQGDPDLFLREALAGEGGAVAVTPEQLGTRKREIETLLVEGVNSGDSIEIDASFWQERRRVLHERIEARKNPENP